ncbi:MAG: hypothetical protein ACI92I_000728 [Acidimicrobiales bacterium]|jgi:hypothetical protein
MQIQVVKADGSSEVFRVEKLKQSLKRAGANNTEIASIVQKIKLILHEGIKTQEIYRLAFELLRESETPVRARYSLRRALFGLGPTGFPFEDFLSRLFEAEGYTTTTRVELQGHCVLHELDVAAYNEDDSFVTEAKFHSRPGVKSDLQVALYSYARLMDLRDTRICNDDVCGIKRLLLATNTKFTSTAEDYAECVGLELLSWSYPKGNNLHDRIREAGLYPITALQTISQSQKKALLERGIIICKDLLKNPGALRHVHIGAKKTERVLEEARALVTNGIVN